jgi:hypothetical protein
MNINETAIIGTSTSSKSNFIQNAVKQKTDRVIMIDSLGHLNDDGTEKKSEFTWNRTNRKKDYQTYASFIDLSAIFNAAHDAMEDVIEDAEFEVIETSQLPSRRHIIQCSYCGEDRVPYNKDEGCNYCVDCYDAAHETSRNTEL